MKQGGKEEKMLDNLWSAHFKGSLRKRETVPLRISCLHKEFKKSGDEFSFPV